MTGTNSTDRILAILDLFTEDRLEWTTEALMAELGYSRPTLYRYLKSLRDAGFLTSLPGGGFTLGPRVVELDYLMRKSDPLVSSGQRHLDALTRSWPCSAALVRWYGSKLLCVASESSTSDPLSSYPRGRPMPLARGAISRAIMAWLPRRQLQPLVEQNLTEMRQIGLGRDAEEVLATLRRVRRAGSATAHGEVTPGVVGIAAPVFDAGQSPIAALAVTIAGHEVTADRLDRICADVMKASAALSCELGERRIEEDLPPLRAVC
jgi:DNA-binding IclR family transcriptional regulator